MQLVVCPILELREHSEKRRSRTRQRRVNISTLERVTEAYPVNSDKRKLQQPLLLFSDRLGNGTEGGDAAPCPSSSVVVLGRRHSFFGDAVRSRLPRHGV